MEDRKRSRSKSKPMDSIQMSKISAKHSQQQQKPTKFAQNQQNINQDHSLSESQQKEIKKLEMLEENQACQERVKLWMEKQNKIKEKTERIQKSRDDKVKDEQIVYKIKKCMSCQRKKEVDKNRQAAQNTDEYQRKKQERLLKKLLTQKNDEEVKIYKARQMWSVVRKKKKVIRMMSSMGGQQIQEMNERNKNNMADTEDTDQAGPTQQKSRFIISPNNYWNMQWNNFTQVVFVIYIFLAPILIVENKTLSLKSMRVLLVFDIMFMLDRLADLFVGYYNPNGLIEHKVYKVILANISLKFFLEIFISFGPIALSSFYDSKSSIYACQKIVRYLRLFEMDGQIAEILDFYGLSRTVFEIKQMKRTLDIAQFSLQTLINLHILTCSMIMLCKVREDSPFADSWMGRRDVDENNFQNQYIIAIYFVTTTLSTCGFGEISATQGDAVESLCILFLQFVGMLFYSMTIQKVQSFMITDEISPGEYANQMVEVVENLIVKVGRQLPIDRKIPGDVIKDWRIYTLKYFQGSPNAFLKENEFYQEISENMKVKIVKDNLLQSFQDKFDILFFDPEFGFKADDKLIAMIASSLSYEHIDETKSIIKQEIVSSGIFFIYKGTVKVYYKDSNYPLVVFEEGSYFGDISFIFQVINQYNYNSSPINNSKFYSLQDKYLNEIFERFPEFKTILQIRALRRQHYFRKLKNQQRYLIDLKDKTQKSKDTPGDMYHISDDLLNMKKARLTEDKMSYEDLAVLENFSDDEITFALNRQNIKDKKDKLALQKAKLLKQQIDSLKSYSIDGMRAIVDTITSIDENSKKILFKHFDQQNVNILAKQAPILISKLSQIAQEAQKIEPFDHINSEHINSDSDGNQSENDEINKIAKLKKRLQIEERMMQDQDSINERDGREESKVDPDDINLIMHKESTESQSLKKRKSQQNKKNELDNSKSYNKQKRQEDLQYKENNDYKSNPETQLEVGQSIQNVNIHKLKIDNSEKGGKSFASSEVRKSGSKKKRSNDFQPKSQKSFQEDQMNTNI